MKNFTNVGAIPCCPRASEIILVWLIDRVVLVSLETVGVVEKLGDFL